MYVNSERVREYESERFKAKDTISHTERNTYAEQSHHITSHIHIHDRRESHPNHPVSSQPTNQSSSTPLLYIIYFLAKQPIFFLSRLYPNQSYSGCHAFIYGVYMFLSFSNLKLCTQQQQ